MSFKNVSSSRVSIIIKTRLFNGGFLGNFQKIFNNFLNSYSGGHLAKAVVRRYSVKRVFSPNSQISFIKKETLIQVPLWEFYKNFQNTVLQNTSARLVLICKFHRSCFSIEGSLWLALIAAINQIVITKVVTNYKITF